MTTRTPLILEIKGNSLDDGPGIRSVVFFKGCPLSCVWCHNPEALKPAAEIAFDAARCVDCGACRDVCPPQALSRDHPAYVDRKRCTLCFACCDVCPSGALERVGQAMGAEEILEKILPDKPFFDASGGGVTLSGGEATLYMAFLGRLLQKLKGRRIHTLLETCGSFDPTRFMRLVYPHLDAIYFDLKIMDSAAHQRFCGLPNRRILANFRELSAAARKDDKTFLPRTPLVPGITDSEENLRAVAAFLRRHGIREAALLAYNPLWHDKRSKLGLDSPYRHDPAMTSFGEPAEMERLKGIYREAGIGLVA